MAVITGVAAPFRDVRRIAVLRGGGLGDLVMALPAVDALAAAYPEAELVLLGTPLHAELLHGRTSSVSRVEVLPVAEGVRAAPRPAPLTGIDRSNASADREVEEFRARLATAGPIDLGVQLHGGGRYSNPFLLALAPRHSVGLATSDAMPLERTLPYVYYQHEVMRWIEVAALAGAAPVTLEPRIVPTDDERRAVSRYLPDDGRPVAVVHPGAGDPRRRWPAARFAQVAAALADDGSHVVVVGDSGEAALAREVAERAHAMRGTTRPVEADRDIQVLAGRLPIGETAALLAASSVVVADDSGPRHLAQAAGAATVGVFWFGNVVNAAPFSRARHRVHLGFTTHCPVCGVDVTQVGWTAERCDHDVSFVADVAVGPVLADARQLMATTAPPTGRRAARGSRSLRAG
jgi:ADP-heptose:LPS heptosyltransferase